MKAKTLTLSLRLLFFLIILILPRSATADTYTVTNNNDSGAGSLRQAILDANANPGADDIIFDTAYDITIDNALIITDSNGDGTTINGDINDDDIPDISILNGGADFSAFYIEAANVTIQGLHIDGFDDAAYAGIEINGASGAKIFNNYLGTSADGNSMGTGNYWDISVVNSAQNADIGDGTSSGRNVIGNNNLISNSIGIRIADSDGVTVSGNYIGLGADGTSDVGGLTGILVQNSTGVNIGQEGENPNIISYHNAGITVTSGSGPVIANNYVGTAATGVANAENDFGIRIAGTAANTIIGSLTGGRNIITSGQYGIDLSGGDNTLIIGNYIGLGANGTTQLGHSNAGIRVTSSATNTAIGNGTAAGRNVISDNLTDIRIEDASATIRGNYIGTTADGSADGSSQIGGINALGPTAMTIGGTGVGDGNLISGNTIGMNIGSNISVLGNFIGTNAAGDGAIANSMGVRLVGANNQIGDGTEQGRNIISGNATGVRMEGSSATGNTIGGNYIGVRADGITPLANLGDGIIILNQANGNTISDNIIANNGSDGIEIGQDAITGIDNNTVSQNSIYQNTDNGILLVNSANNGIAPPAITSTVDGLILGTSMADATIEIFADAADQGEQFLSTATADGNGDFSHQISVASINSGLTNISVTQTDGQNTSEYTTAVLEEGLPERPPSSVGLYFDGEDDYVEALGTEAVYHFAGTATYTIESWIKIPEIKKGENTIASKFQHAGPSTWRLYVEADRTLTTYRNSVSGPFILTTPNPLPTNDWIHIAVTYDGSTTRIYVNGLEEISGAMASQVLGGTAQNLTFGASWASGSVPTSFFTGQIDEVQIWDVARSQLEIQEDMANESPSDANLIGYWDFNDDLTAGNQTTAQDLAGGGWEGTINGALWAHRVVNTDDSGSGSLRDAITIANSDTDTDFIGFDISSSDPNYNLDEISGNEQWTIQPVSNLPNITAGIVLDATTQPGVGNYNIKIDGQGPLNTGISVTAGFGEIYGFEITGFNANSSSGGVHIFHIQSTESIIGDVDKGNVINGCRNGIYVLQSGTNIIQGNLIGTDTTGTTSIANSTGIFLGTGANATIGGSLAGEGNLISGNTGSGIGTNASGNHWVEGNLIGTDISGLLALPNGTGISFGTGSGNQVLNNIISGNTNNGIFFNQTSTSTIQGNRIGLNASDAALPNNYGINSLGNPSSVTGLLIGGLGAGDANQIAHNTTAGVALNSPADNNNQIIRNEMYCNGVGIDLNGGANNNIQPPVITRVSSSSVSGTGVDGDVIHIYRDNSTCDPAQSQEYLGSATVGSTVSGEWDANSLSSAINVGTDVITATATHATDGTSEITGQDPYLVINTLNDGIGSLRWAMTNAIASPTKQTISFNLPGDGSNDSWKIDVASPRLPVMTNAGVGLIIDGTTQPGWNIDQGLMPRIDGAINGVNVGLEIGSQGNVEIYGLHITGFTQIGIFGQTLPVGPDNSKIGAPNKGNVISANGNGIIFWQCNNCYIQGNRIGTTPDGLSADGNESSGIVLGYTTGPFIIGGNRGAGEGNVISANGAIIEDGDISEYGIFIFDGASDVQIYGNLIGTDINGENNLGNRTGLIISNGTTNNCIIGSPTPGYENVISGSYQLANVYFGTDTDNCILQNNVIGLNANGDTAIGSVASDIPGVLVYNISTDLGNQIIDNVISGNTGDGIYLEDVQSGFVLDGNLIGIGSDGTTAIGNNGHGILIGDATTSTTIGGTGVENTIANNTGSGIFFENLSSDNGNDILRNFYYCNDQEGIAFELTPTVAELVFTSFTSSEMSGTSSAANGSAIDIYLVNPSCSDDQGAAYFASTTVSGGAWTYTGAVNTSLNYVATVTDATNGISEFALSIVGPSDLNVTEVSPTQIDLSWTDHSSNETGFSIERSDINNTNFVEVATVGADETTYSSTVTPEMGYYYRVRAINNAGSSPASNEEFAGAFTPPGNALDFDGSNDYASFSAPNFTAYTIEAWVKLKSSNNEQSVIRYTPGGIGTSHNILTDADGHFQHYFFAGSAKVVVGTSIAKIGQWYHVAIVAENGGLARLYVNGVEEGTPQSVGTLYTGGNQFRVGDASTIFGSNTTNFLNGVVDELRIWNIARSEADIISTIKSRLDGDEPGLIAYFPMDQGAAESDNTGLTTALNLAGSNDAALTNFSLTGATSNWVESEAFTPFEPTDLYTIVSGGNVQLYWTDNSFNEDDFLIERSEGDRTNFLQIDMVEAESESYVDSDVLAGAGYFYRVIASSDQNGVSAPSNEKFAGAIAPPGHTLDFDGVDDVVVIPEESSLDFGDEDFSLEFWLSTTTTSQSTLIAKHECGYANGWYTAVQGNLLQFSVNGSNLYSTTEVNDGNWHHVAVTFNATSNTQTIYIDGTLETSQVGVDGSANNIDISIGSFTASACSSPGFDPFDGQIDEVRIWNSVRSLEEIESNMTSELIGNENDLTAYYRFDQGVAEGDNTSPMINLLPDRSVNNNNGMLMNFGLTGNSSNWVASSVGLDPYTVINTNDDGVGSLRWAIENANASTSKETISFNITESSPWDIVLDSFLPTIDNSNDVGVIIDATTQPGWTFGDPNAMIILDGATNAINGNGLTIEEPNVEIYGLVIDGFFRGIRYNDGSHNLIIGAPGNGNIIKGSTSSGIISAGAADNMVIQGNYIGLDYDGLSADQNRGTGIHASGDNILIGGNSNDGEGNVISGNGTSGVQYGISIEEGDNVQIYGNLLGTDKNGENDLGNLRGIRVRIGVTNARIGGQGTGQANVISGTNSAYSVHLEYGTGTIVDSNIIGLDASGTTAIPNQGNGIDIDGTAGSDIIIRNNTISASVLHGIYVDNLTTNLQIINNNIGTAASGTIGGGSLGNTNHGIVFNASGGIDNLTQKMHIEDNVISGNGSNGIHFAGASSNFLVINNKIGVGSNGNGPLGNSGSGIELSSSTTNIEIGGVSQQNIIANNTLDGIRLEGLSQETSGAILGINSYFCNDQEAINFTNLPTVAAPIISSVTAEDVSGTTSAFNGSTVDVYQINTSCADNQGAVYVGESTVFDGNWNYNLPVDPGQTYVATVTDVNNGISEFSASATASLVNGVIESDYDALVALYNSTDGDNWITNTNWLSAEDVSDWYGVTVVGNTVTAIDLCENELNGIIPDDLIGLGSLTSLLLTENQLTGIPDLSSMTSLSILNVAENQMDFEDILPNVGISTYQYAPQSELVGLTDLSLAQCDDLEVSLITNGTGNSFQWIKDGESISGQTSNNLFISDVKPEDEGTYKIQVTNSQAPDLTLTSVSFELTIEAFIPTITEVAAVFAVTELAASKGDSYQWFEDGSAMNGETNASLFLTHQYTTSPAYTVEVTLDGCTAVSEPYFRAILSSPSQVANKIEVYPNPTTGQLIIRLNESISQLIHFKFFNITGVEVFSTKCLNNQPINISHLNQGVYFIQTDVEHELIRILKK